LRGELQDTARHLVVIGRGRLMSDVSVRDLFAAATRGRVMLRMPARTEAMTALAHASATVASTERDVLTVIPRAKPIAVTVDNHSFVGVGVALIEETSIGGDFRVSHASAPTRPWSE
jgi:hypothetical protein